MREGCCRAGMPPPPPLPLEPQSVRGRSRRSKPLGCARCQEQRRCQQLSGRGLASAAAAPAAAGGGGAASSREDEPSSPPRHLVHAWDHPECGQSLSIEAQRVARLLTVLVSSKPPLQAHGSLQRFLSLPCQLARSSSGTRVESRSDGEAPFFQQPVVEQSSCMGRWSKQCYETCPSYDGNSFAFTDLEYGTATGVPPSGSNTSDNTSKGPREVRHDVNRLWIELQCSKAHSSECSRRLDNTERMLEKVIQFQKQMASLLSITRVQACHLQNLRNTDALVCRDACKGQSTGRRNGCEAKYANWDTAIQQLEAALAERTEARLADAEARLVGAQSLFRADLEHVSEVLSAYKDDLQRTQANLEDLKSRVFSLEESCKVMTPAISQPQLPPFPPQPLAKQRALSIAGAMAGQRRVSLAGSVLATTESRSPGGTILSRSTRELESPPLSLPCQQSPVHQDMPARAVWTMMPKAGVPQHKPQERCVLEVLQQQLAGKVSGIVSSFNHSTAPSASHSQQQVQQHQFLNLQVRQQHQLQVAERRSSSGNSTRSI